MANRSHDPIGSRDFFFFLRHEGRQVDDFNSVCVKKSQTVLFVQLVEIFLKTFSSLALLSHVDLARAWGF